MRHHPTANGPGVWRKLGAMLLVAMALSACSRPQANTRPASEATILVQGSSTVYPITREAARRFARVRAQADIRVSPGGSTAGFRQFCAGKTDVNNASRSINDEERAACAAAGVEWLALPIAMDAIALVVHPKNSWAKDITTAELAVLWSPQAQDKIKTWAQVRDSWPDEPIHLYGRGQNSGTYDTFTRLIVGQARSSRHDYTASEDEQALAADMATDVNALGFFGMGAYHRHWDTLKLLAVDNGQGPVYPSVETVRQGRYQPLTRPLYLYVNTARLAQKPDLEPFLQHYLRGLNQWIAFTGYMPIAQARLDQGLSRLTRTQ